MSDSFEPFSPLGASRRETPRDFSTSSPGGGQIDAAALFKAIESSRPANGTGNCRHEGSAGGGSGKKPKIVLERDENSVTRIRIECPCGQEIVLDCEYGEQA